MSTSACTSRSDRPPTHGRSAGGARLSHSHTRQFIYLYQTLTLWRFIVHDFYKLWFMAEGDMLDETNRYALRDTGQGLNRVQAVRSRQRCEAWGGG